MSTRTPVCELLGIEHPIAQAPISADPRLPAAASNAGKPQTHASPHTCRGAPLGWCRGWRLGPDERVRADYETTTVKLAVAVWWTFLVWSVTFTVIGNEPPWGYALAFTVPESSPAEFSLSPLGRLPAIFRQL
jgi:hypothetical protein